MPTPHTLAALLVAFSLFSCGPQEGAAHDDGPTSSTQAITNGNARSEAAFGGALVTAPAALCSGAFLAPDLVLTSARCRAATKVSVAGQTIGIELARTLPFSAELITLQLRGKAAPTVFTWKPTSTRVTNGESLSCFGFDASRLFTSGQFKVVDLAGDSIALQGGNAFGVGVTFGVESTDDGGFCIRDGGFEIVAVLSSSLPGVPRALQIDALGPVLVDLLVAVNQARSQFAVTLVNDPNAATPSALTLNGTVLSGLPRVARDPRQGLYLAPTGQPDVYALINAQTGTCVAGNSPFPLFGRSFGQRCSFGGASQQWVLVYRSGAFASGLTDGYLFRWLPDQSQCLSINGLFLVPCTSSAAVFGMWLNMF